jgi:hypothetical protein
VAAAAKGDQAPGPELPACPHCGSRSVVHGLRLNQNAEVGDIGLPYRSAKIFTRAEALHADLCATCGTVLRLFVKEPKRHWIPS